MVSLVNALAFAFAGAYLLEGYRTRRAQRTHLFWGAGLAVAALPHLLATLQFWGLIPQDRYALLSFLVINHAALVLLFAGTLLLISERRALYLGLPVAYGVSWSAVTTGLAFTTQAPDLTYRLFSLNIWGYFIPLELVMVGIFLYAARFRGIRGYLIVALGYLIIVTGNAFWAPSLGTESAWVPRSALFVGTAAILVGFTYIGKEEEIRRRNRELAVLNSVAAAVSSSLELEEVLNLALDQVLKATGAQAAEVFLLNEEGDALDMAAYRGTLPESFREITRFNLGEGFPGRVAQSGEPMVTTDLAGDLRYLRKAVIEAGFGSFACIPLWAKGKVVGTIDVAALGRRPWSADELKLLVAIGHQIGIAVENARLFQALEKKTARLNALRQVDLAIMAEQDLMKVLRLIIDSARDLVGARLGEIKLIDPEKAEATAVVHSGLEPDGCLLKSEPSIRGVQWKIFEKGVSVRLKDIPAEPDSVGLPESHPMLRGLLGVPVKNAQGQVIAFLLLTDKADGRDFTEDDEEIVEALANQAAVAIENARLYEQVKAYAAEMEQQVAERTAELKAANEKLQRALREQAALAEIEVAVSQPRELQQALDQIVAAVTRHVGADSASVVLWDPVKEESTVSASTVPGQTAQMAAQREDGATRWIIDHAQPLVVPDVRDDPFGANPLPAEFRNGAYAGVPLLAEGRAIGVLYALSRRPRKFSQHELDFMAALANRAAIAITKVQIYQKLKARTRQLATSARELESFTYSVSHDLRAPLRHIDGFTKILVEDYGDQLGPEARRHLDRVRAAAQKMGALIDDLLALSRLEKKKITRQRVDLVSLTHEIIEEQKTDLGDREVEFVVGDLLPAQCDPTLIRAVLQNLIENAIKFTRPREKARIEIGCDVQPDGVPAYYVRDNGVGFDMKYVDKLFGVFQRLHKAEEFEGTGVGLATVRRVIHKHGGRVWAEGEPGKGATFYFTLREEVL